MDLFGEPTCGALLRRRGHTILPVSPCLNMTPTFALRASNCINLSCHHWLSNTPTPSKLSSSMSLNMSAGGIVWSQALAPLHFVHGIPNFSEGDNTQIVKQIYFRNLSQRQLPTCFSCRSPSLACKVVDHENQSCNMVAFEVNIQFCFSVCLFWFLWSSSERNRHCHLQAQLSYFATNPYNAAKRCPP